MAADQSWIELGLSWLTTYLLHSTVLLGGAWAVTRCWRRLPDTVQETMWKTALLGGVLTTSWQMLSPSEPYGGTVQLAMLSVEAPAPEAAVPAGSGVAQPRFEAVDLGLAERLEAAAEPEADIDAARTATDPTLLGVSLYGGVVLIAIIHLVIARRRFYGRLANRQLVTEGPMPLQLLRLVRRSGFARAVRLTVSDHVSTPVAFGLLQPEICVPTRALVGLGSDEQEGLLAHELAHLLRRDPVWLLLCQTLQRVLFVQPLHVVARRSLHRIAEYRCDAWATRNAASSASLARCLVEVARWIAPQPGPSLASGLGMATRSSLLRERVERILDDATPPAHGRLTAVVCAAALALVAEGLPGATWAATRTDDGALATPVEMLDTAPGLEALGDELWALDQELAGLCSTLDDSNPDAGVRALVEQLEAQASKLGARRDDMQDLLPASLDALATGVTTEAGIPVSDPEGR